MVSTVTEHKKLFSRCKILAADTARALYCKIGRPNEAEFQVILRNNMIHNCPVTPDDAKRALIIYGPDIAALKDKTTQTGAAPRAPAFVAKPIPATILEHQSNVTLCVDFFFVQDLAYFHTISRGLGYRTAHSVPDRTQGTILKHLRHVIAVYTARGFTGLPFERLRRLFVTHMVADAIRCLNQIPPTNGISSTLSPAGIMTGVAPPEKNLMRVEFGSYVQVFKDNDPTNTLCSRLLGAIALTPTGDAQ